MTRIIYLHGFASGPNSKKAQYFRPVLQAAGAEVEVPDLARGDFEHLTITGQLASVGETVGTGPVSLVGSSMGGYVAALYAARHAEVRKLVLLAPAFGFARRWAERLGAAQMGLWRRAGAMEVFHYGQDRNCKLGYQLMADAERYEDYPDFRQPALIFHGAHDGVVPAQYSREFAASHANVTLEIVDAGHELLEALDLMGPRAVEFLGAP
jgi:uncharacterized protein